MKKLSAGVLLLLISVTVFADKNWNYSIVTYLENRSHLGEFNQDDVIIAPSLGVSVARKDVFYFKYIFEYWDQHGTSTAELQDKGNEMRSKFYLGNHYKISTLIFNPEYELRMRNFKGYAPSDKVIYEHRLHLNTSYPFSDNISLFLYLMPTYMLNTEDRGEGIKTYNDYYQEHELGFAFRFTQRDKLSLSLYNESEYQEEVPGLKEYFNEYQARIVYDYKFQSGISLTPFARIGLYKKAVTETDTSTIKSDFRRSRYGFKTAYSTPAGLNPFGEFYFEKENRGSTDDVRYRIMWKAGMTWVF